MTFDELGLSPEVLKAVKQAGYTDPTPIQGKAIPYVLMGRDLLGTAQTGTGKTASFLLPMIDILSAGKAKTRMPRGLILEPTRELAMQIEDAFDVYSHHHEKLTSVVLIGGVGYGDQDQKLMRGVDVIIATPGRLLDAFERGRILLSDIKCLVIDEADRMMDMGFMPDLERIVALVPTIRQTLFFSATMPPEIRRLADKFLINPKEVAVDPPATAAEMVTQGLARVDGGPKEKRAALRQLIQNENIRNCLIFCNRKRDVGILYRSMQRHGFDVGQLHGDMDQNERMATLERFREGAVTMLVCSDVAARGLDIQGLSHVFNFDVPINAEDYIHRIGRTGRAGLPGRAFTIATGADTKYVHQIEKLIGRKIPVVPIEGFDAPQPAAAETGRKGRQRRGRDRRRDDERKTVAKDPTKTKAKATGGKSGRSRRGGERKAEPADAGKPVIGMGDHVPAFLTRPIRKPRSEK